MEISKSTKELRVEKKDGGGLFSKFLSTISSINFIKPKQETKLENNSKSIFYSNVTENNMSIGDIKKNKRFIQVVNQVLITIREKKKKSKKAKLESIVDMIMSQKVSRLGHITKSNSEFRDIKITRSLSCPNNLSMLRKKTENILTKNSRLSCSCSDKFSIFNTDKQHSRKEKSPFLSRESSFESNRSSSSSKNSTMSDDFEQPKRFQRYVKKNHGLNDNCNQEIV